MSEQYLVIKCGHEGIEGLVHLTSDKDEASRKVLAIRALIAEMKERKKRVIEESRKEDSNLDEDGEDDDGNDAWRKLMSSEKITYSEYEMGQYGEPDAYCVQIWDGKSFKCCCKELNVAPKQTWLM